MKKTYLFLLSLLLGCVRTERPVRLMNSDVVKVENNQKVVDFDEQNTVVPEEKIEPVLEEKEKCMSVRKVKVFQVLDDGSALAEECEEGQKYCFGITVFLEARRGVDYYDGMIISIPEDRCFIQNGVYKYWGKTVPVLSYSYRYQPISEEDAFMQLKDYEEHMNFSCKNDLKFRKKDTEKNLKKCDCISETIFERVWNNSDGNIKVELEKKCGDLSNF